MSKKDVVVGMIQSYRFVIDMYWRKIQANLGLIKMEDEFDNTLKFAHTILLRTVLYFVMIIFGIVGGYYLAGLLLRTGLKWI